MLEVFFVSSEDQVLGEVRTVAHASIPVGLRWQGDAFGFKFELQMLSTHQNFVNGRSS